MKQRIIHDGEIVRNTDTMWLWLTHIHNDWYNESYPERVPPNLNQWFAEVTSRCFSNFKFILKFNICVQGRGRPWEKIA